MNTFAMLVSDTVLLLLLTMSIPFAILMLGAPVSLIIRLTLEIVRAFS